jgi:predicted nucleotidyltransferase component of viral defense system
MMKLTAEQLKGRIKSLALKNHADARMILRIYMMERFLERVSLSQYKDNFILKGGVLVTSLIGIALRATMDIDTTIKNLNVSDNDIREMIDRIIAIPLDDGVSFHIKQISHIMDEMEYPGIRVTLDGISGKLLIPMKIDISTGDAVTPREVGYEYKLLLENRSIVLWSYNIETLLAEKMQTILVRGILNTRMRDFYDIYELTKLYSNQIDNNVLKAAFHATCLQRNTLQIENNGSHIIDIIGDDEHMKILWKSYQRKFGYAREASYNDAIQSITKLWQLLKS